MVEPIDAETLRASLCGCQDALRRVCDIDAESADVEAIRYLLAAEDLISEFDSL